MSRSGRHANTARQKKWPGADAAAIREAKRSWIYERLEQAGVDTALEKTVSKHARFATINGEDPEDILHEAIAASLAGESPITAMVKIMHQKRYEANVDPRPKEGMVDIWDFIERSSPIDEQPDWIPDDPAERAQLLRDCQAALIRADKPRALDVSELGSSYRAVLSMRGYQQKAGCFKKDSDRAEAEKEALRKIIFWCSPDDAVTAQSEIVKFSNFWASYKRRHMMEDVALDSINSREEFLGVPAALWPLKLAA